MLHKLYIKDLHLAAYMKYNGVEFTDFNTECFVFTSEKSENEWRVLHSKSCCRGVDVELINLRKFLRKTK
jgi:hypothetical protein